MAEHTRIHRKPSEFDAYMNLTDELQKSILTPPTTQRYTLWGWTQEESEQWTIFRLESNLLYADYTNADLIGPMVRKKMHDHIALVRNYDNDRLVGHKLLDMVARNGTIDDYSIFNVKRGTTLQSPPVQHADEPSMQPKISLQKAGYGNHIIRLEDPDQPDSHSLPDGMASAKLYRYIGVNQPEDERLYEWIGNAKRGYVTSEFYDYMPQEPNVKYYAWYFGRYESNKGKLGAHGNILKVEIMQFTA
jgi:hypothetical protein